MSTAAEQRIPVTKTHPAHYARFAIEPIEFISKNNIGFAAGNVIKYVCRQDAKDGLADLHKARYYLDAIIKAAEEKEAAEAASPIKFV